MLLAHGLAMAFTREHPVSTLLVVGLAVVGVLAGAGLWPGTSDSGRLGDVVAMAAVIRLMTIDGGLDGWFWFWPAALTFWAAVVRHNAHTGWVAALAGLGYAATAAHSFPLDQVGTTRLIVIGGAALLIGAGHTQVRHRDRRVQHLETFLADALDSAPVAVAVVDPRTGRINYANRTAAEWVERPLTGSTVVKEQESLETMGIRAQSSDIGQFLATVGTGTPVTEVFTFTMPSGAQRHLRLVAAPHTDRKGRPASTVVWAEDVTSQIQTGEERRRFLEAAGHHLRTPLTPIVGWAQMLADGTLGPEHHDEAVGEILEGARSLERLFDRMLSVTRLPYNPGLSDIQVGELLDRHLQSLDRSLYREITIEGDRDIPVRCHPDAIAGSLYELFDNSRRFGEKPYLLTWAPTDTVVEMRAGDAGPGPVLPAGRTQNLLPWSPLSPSDEMPKEMGNRLGLAHATTLASLGGSRLDFIRTSERWHFALRLPERLSSRNVASPA